MYTTFELLTNKQFQYIVNNVGYHRVHIMYLDYVPLWPDDG